MSLQLGKWCRIIAIAVSASAYAAVAHAENLTIGTRNTPSIDPHFMFVETNVGFSAHIYGFLTYTDDKSQVIPDLAESWRLIEDTIWEFTLRQGVKFHDGSNFTAADVEFSFARVPAVPNNPSPYSGLLDQIERLEVVDPQTIRIHTDGPRPFLPVDLASIAIVSSTAAAGASTADFESGAAAIGTGPYRFVENLPGERVVLQRNDDYWGEPAPWEQVTLRIIHDSAARTAALLSGSVDVIDFVPPASAPRIMGEPELVIHSGPSNRTMFMSIDRYSDEMSPFVTAKGGGQLDKNPFSDLRVRQALSLAIDRELLVARVMDGLAIPASQYVVPGFLGHVDTLDVDPFDPQRAMELLSEAGYPDGFALTIHCTNDRYINDAQVCQALAQMLAQVGLDMSVETMPVAIFFERARRPLLDGSMEAEFSLMLWGWGASGGEADVLWGGLRTPDIGAGQATWNLGAYSNPEADVLIDTGLNTLDREARGKLLREAMSLIVADYAAIPLYYQTVVVATRKGIDYEVRVDERTTATSARPSE